MVVGDAVRLVLDDLGRAHKGGSGHDGDCERRVWSNSIRLVFVGALDVDTMLKSSVVVLVGKRSRKSLISSSAHTRSTSAGDGSTED